MDINTIFLSIAAVLIALVAWMVKTATNAATAQALINTRFAELETLVKDLRVENSQLKTEQATLRTSAETAQSTIAAQQSEINTLKQQVSDLTAVGRVNKDDLKAKDAEIARLNLELQRVLTTAMPPGLVQVMPQQLAPAPAAPAVAPAPAIASGTEAIQQIEIINPEDRPVPVIAQPDKADNPAPDMDAHGLNNEQQNARSTAELERRLSASGRPTPPPETSEPPPTSEEDAA